MTKLSSALPQGDSNGLGAIARDLIDTPEEPHPVIVMLDTCKLTTNIDTGDVVATARVMRIEPILHEEDRRILSEILRRAFERRTGKVVLPFDLEKDLQAIYETVDLTTGERIEDKAQGEPEDE